LLQVWGEIYLSAFIPIILALARRIKAEHRGIGRPSEYGAYSCCIKAPMGQKKKAAPSVNSRRFVKFLDNGFNKRICFVSIPVIQERKRAGSPENTSPPYSIR